MGDTTGSSSGDSADQPANTSGTTGELKTLSLVKGQNYFCFRYEVGQEGKVLDALVDMVHKTERKFDWFDAAILAHQLGRHLAKELKSYMPKKVA